MTELKPEIISMLKRQRRLGILCIGAMVVTAAAGVLFTIEYSKYGEISSIITFAVVFILGLFAANYSAGSAIVEKFSTSGSVFVLLAGLLLCGGIAYYAYSRFYAVRDYDAATAFSLMGAFFCFYPMLSGFTLYKYKTGVYRKIIEMNEKLKKTQGRG
ncbi:MULTISPECIES: hypothetical protein [Culturomica]|jgi:uncharacterized membrane protein|uniref:hypothetical protein n=1 Tax=Culturomica TaxID=1926651 RepID=UPI000838DC10|nr:MULTISPECIES: hypothetical protein [Odoribacteraceae]HBO27320.1 hypothetical protein [Culturomica sp.]